jgi:uncharacterized protein DUF3253
MTRTEIESAIRALLEEGDLESSICPSDVARSLADSSSDEWRQLMPQVRRVASELAAKGQIRITRGAQELDPGDLTGGPLRLRRGPKFAA